jgi:hypothetical protein
MRYQSKRLKRLAAWAILLAAGMGSARAGELFFRPRICMPSSCTSCTDSCTASASDLPTDPSQPPDPMSPDMADQPQLPLEQFAALGSDTFALADAGTAYIDVARPMDLIRLRFDSAYHSDRPNRAEYFYARGAPFGPGLPVVETRLDYQDYSMYLEKTVGDNFSLFVDMAAHALNPTVNDNTMGLGDMNAGFKRAFVNDADRVVTLQFKTYMATGDVDRGLGTGHASVEPGLLGYRRMSDRWSLASEVRYWVPIQGTPGFAGDIFRAGIGSSYVLWSDQQGRHITPILEVVSWTVLGGMETAATSPTSFVNTSAAGDVIVNVKPGVRFGLSSMSDLYFGYGRAVTGHVWYEDIARVEFRRRF